MKSKQIHHIVTQGGWNWIFIIWSYFMSHPVMEAKKNPDSETSR